MAVSVAPKVAWGTNLTFETAIEITSRYSLLTGIAEYNNTVYAATDDNVWELKDGSFARVPITIDRARDERNGVAMAWWNTQLFFSFCPIVTGKQIGRASCRERVYVLV